MPLPKTTRNGQAPGSGGASPQYGEGWGSLPVSRVPLQPARARMWPSSSPAAPGGRHPEGRRRRLASPGLPRLPGDDNFPATGSSWPGSAALPPPAPGDGHAVPTGGWGRRQRALSGPLLRLVVPRAGGPGRRTRAGPLTGAAGVAAASGSNAPGAGVRSPPPPPPAAAGPQWLGLGLGGSPESGLSRTPSPFFFVSTSSGTSCRLSRPTMAVRAAGPGLGLRASQAREGRRRGPGPLPARPPSLPAARAPSGSRRRSAPAPPPPRPGPARPARSARAQSRGRAPGGAALPPCAALFPAAQPAPRGRSGRAGAPGGEAAPTPCGSRPATGERAAPLPPGPGWRLVPSPCPGRAGSL